MPKVIIEAKAKANESNANILRRFSRKVRDAGIIKKSRSQRFYERGQSETIQKKEALRSIRRRKEVEKLIKLGKLRDTRARKVEIKSGSKEKNEEK